MDTNFFIFASLNYSFADGSVPESKATLFRRSSIRFEDPFWVVCTEQNPAMILPVRAFRRKIPVIVSFFAKVLD